MRLFCFLLLVPVWVVAQSPVVPARMEFAGIKLRLMDDAREEIQKDVDALTRSPKHFNIKVERAKAYFPIIERVFREEGLHDDFKYLVLQESALIPDAVSVSDAVGFWQFKDFTAMEVGLRVDNHIDERMNIVAASRGAARYMKKNNQFFDNWLHTLQAYQMGPGGAMRALKKDEKGAKSMVIDKRTYWYVKKYLAHKIAFEGAVDGPGETKLVEYTEGKNKSLKDISAETGIAQTQLEEYNKWLRKGKIPDDRSYTVILPVSRLDNINIAALEPEKKPVVERKMEYRFPLTEQFPEISEPDLAASGHVVEINGLPGIIARAGDNSKTLAKKGEIDLSKFLKYNDMEINDRIIEGQVYYFRKKRAKAGAHYYVAQPEESLWAISQKFGLKLKKLKMKNRVTDGDKVKPGRVLWLRYLRPARIAIEYREIAPKPLPEKQILAKTNAVSQPSDSPSGSERKQQPVEQVSENPESPAVDSADESDSLIVAEVQVEGQQNMENPGVISSEETEEDPEEQASVGLDIDDRSHVKKVHIVEPGETLYSISKLHEVTVRQLLEWNKLNISDAISIGQKLSVLVKREPEKSKAAEPREKAENYVYYTVGEGDTLYKIARSYDVTIEEIMTWNNKTDFGIHLGERIKIIKRQAN